MDKETPKMSKIGLKETEQNKKKYNRVASYEKKCVVCGKTFIAHSEKGEFCSRACQYQSRKKRKIEEKRAEEEKIAIGLIQKQKEEQHQAEIQKAFIQQRQAEEQTEKFISWCRAHPLLVAGALVVGGLYINDEYKKMKRKSKKI